MLLIEDKTSVGIKMGQPFIGLRVGQMPLIKIPPYSCQLVRSVGIARAKNVHLFHVAIFI